MSVRCRRHARASLLALLGALTPIPALGEAPAVAAYSVRELMQPSQVTAIALSPSGEHVVYALRAPGTSADVIRVVDVGDPGAIAAVTRIELVTGDEGARVARLQWVDDVHVLAEIGTNLLQSRQHVRRGIESYVRTINSSKWYRFNAIQGGTGLPLDQRVTEDSLLEDPLPDPGFIAVQSSSAPRPTLYRLEVATGQMTVLEQGDPITCCWRMQGGRAVMKVNQRPHSNRIDLYRRPEGDPAGWTLARSYEWGEMYELMATSLSKGPEDTHYFVRMRRDGADKYGIFVYDWAIGRVVAAVAEGRHFDLDSALFTQNRFLAAEYTDDRLRQEFADREMNEAYRALGARFGPDTSVRVFQTSSTGNRWLLRVSGPRHPPTYHVFDVSDGRLGDVVAGYPWLEPERLATTVTLNFTTRDNLDLTAYLTCPLWRGDSAFPLVVVPPPEPDARSFLRFDPEAQSFAAEGWCVLEPNYRGVAGLGLKFEELGHGQWSTGIARDVVDAIQAAVAQGFARPDAVGFFAKRLGAYAALSASIQEPEMFQACVARDPVTDFDRVVNELRMMYTKDSPIVQEWMRNRGEELRSSSPIAQVDELGCPLLVIHRQGPYEIPIASSETLAKKLWPTPVDDTLVRLPEEKSWAQLAVNERDTIERAVVHLRKYLPYGLDTGLSTEPAPADNTERRTPPVPPAASPSLDNCIQPSLVDRETCRGRIRIGLGRAEVEAVLGSPDAVTRDGSTAQYGDRFLKFDGEGNLKQIGDRPL